MLSLLLLLLLFLLLQKVPWATIESVVEMFRLEDADRLLGGRPDYVVDCIDDVVWLLFLIMIFCRCL